MSTALALINRIRAKAREEQITAFASGDNLTIALLPELNRAIRVVLEERSWAFQHRSDGTLAVKPGFVDTGAAITSATAATLTIEAALPLVTDIAGSFRTSLVMPTALDYGNTAFDLKVARIGGFTTLLVEFPGPMPAANIVSSDWTLFSYQYALPATVKAVTRVWHQEEDIELFQEPEDDFHTLIPRPYDDYGTKPRVAFVGGTITTTSGVSGGTGTEENAIKFWPVPGTSFFINYSYLCRYADLVAATDALNGVPSSVEDDITQLAYAFQLSSIQNDAQRGMELESRVMAEIDRKHRNHKFDPNRHRRLKSLDELNRRPTELLRAHRTVPGWP